MTIFNVATSMLWGGTVEGDQRDSLAAEFRETVSDMTELQGRPIVSDFFPSLARFDLQGIEKQMHKLAHKFDTIFENMINQRLKIGGGEDGESAKNKDFLQVLLEVKDVGDSKTPFTVTCSLWQFGQPSSKVAGGDVTTIRSGSEGRITLQYLLFTKGNYTTLLIKMRVNLQTQGVWDAIEHDNDVEQRRDRTTLVAFYQAVSEDIILMLAEKDSTKAA